MDYFDWHIPYFLQFSLQIIIIFHLIFHPLFNSAIKGECKVNGFALILSIITISGLLASMKWSVYIVKSHIFQESFSTTFSGSFLFHFYLHQNQFFWILPNVSFCPLSHASFYTLFVPKLGIHTLCVSLSHLLCHTINT